MVRVGVAKLFVVDPCSPSSPSAESAVEIAALHCKRQESLRYFEPQTCRETYNHRALKYSLPPNTQFTTDQSDFSNPSPQMNQ